MPGGRRNPGSKNTPTGKGVRSQSGERISTSNGDEKKIEEKTLAPKHIPIPTMIVDNQLTFETISFFICFFVASLQMLNLYRTVWWLPQSYNNYSMNFYLIDPHLVVFITTATSRRFVYSLVEKLMGMSFPSRWLSTVQKIVRIIFLVLITCILSWSLLQIANRHTSIKIFYLCYPSLSVYLLMFGVRLGPFLETPSLDVKENHNCSFNPAAIREEASNFRTDFNRRLKRVLFASSGSAYICGVAPILFVPQHLYFNVNWAVQYAIFFWFGRLSAHFVQAYPMKYCDVLHRTALHLGKWSVVQLNKNNCTQAPNWNDTVLWPHGSIVKHNKEIYRSEGICTAAEPGNSNHLRFYTWFYNPSWLFSLLWFLQFSLVLTQMLTLLYTNEWYQILSMTMLVLFSYYTLFQVTRDYLISTRIYRVEQIIQEKYQTVHHSTVQ